MDYKPYTKVITTKDYYGECAIYEPHPFRESAIGTNIGINNDVWCWVHYDICGNPVGLSAKMPDGEMVDKFTEENIGSQGLADYLNKEPANIIS